jgi:hypothetical protein
MVTPRHVRPGDLCPRCSTPTVVDFQQPVCPLEVCRELEPCSVPGHQTEAYSTTIRTWLMGRGGMEESQRWFCRRCGTDVTPLRLR